MRIGETLRKAAGLLVEIDEPSAEAEFYKTMSTGPKPAPRPAATPTPAPAPAPAPSTRTVEQVVRESPGPNLDEIKAPAAAAPTVIQADGSIDFGAIYRLATLPSSPFTAEQILDLLNSLPAELPLETKRATVKVTLTAMAQSLGVSTETILADASRKLAALAAYAQSYVQHVDEYVNKSEVEIAVLEQEISKRREAIAEAKLKQASIADACHTESDRLDDVLEFFSLDSPPSKYA